MDSRIALVTWEFFIRLLKRLRYDVFDVWLHESLKLMKRVTECSGHNKDCRLLGYFSGTKSTPTNWKKGKGPVTQSPYLAESIFSAGASFNWRFQNRLTGTSKENRPSGRPDIFV
jgi:hypothetical protein